MCYPFPDVHTPKQDINEQFPTKLPDFKYQYPPVGVQHAAGKIARTSVLVMHGQTPISAFFLSVHRRTFGIMHFAIQRPLSSASQLACQSVKLQLRSWVAITVQSPSNLLR